MAPQQLGLDPESLVAVAQAGTHGNVRREGREGKKKNEFDLEGDLTVGPRSTGLQRTKEVCPTRLACRSYSDRSAGRGHNPDCLNENSSGIWFSVYD